MNKIVIGVVVIGVLTIAYVAYELAQILGHV
jgi:hypothetical protein